MKSRISYIVYIVLFFCISLIPFKPVQAADNEILLKEFAYTGSMQTWTVPATGLYKLEVWGGAGDEAFAYDEDDENTWYDDPEWGRGGAGGYASAEFRLETGTVLYIGVGNGGGLVSNDSRFPTRYPTNVYEGSVFCDTSNGTSVGAYFNYNPHGSSDGGYGRTTSYGGFSNTSGRIGGETHIALTNTLSKDTTSANMLIVAGGGGRGSANDNSDSASNGSNANANYTYAASYAQNFNRGYYAQRKRGKAMIWQLGPMVESVDERDLEDGTKELTVNACGGTGPYLYAMGDEEYHESNTFIVSKNGYVNFKIKDSTDLESGETPYLVKTFKPAITGVTYTYNEPDNTVTFSVSRTDSGSESYTYACTGYEYIANQTSNQFTVSRNGVYLFQVSDNYGNKSEPKIVEINDIIPTITDITQEYDSESNRVKVEISVEDSNSLPYYYGLSEDEIDKGSVIYIEKNGIISFYAKDTYGNISKPKSITITSIKPQIVSVDEVYDEEKNQLIATVNEKGSGASYQYKIGDGEWQNSPDFIIDKNGNYVFHVKDNLGNEEVAPYEITIRSVRPVITGIEQNHEEPDNTTTLTLSFSDNNALPYDFRINRGEWQSEASFVVFKNGVYELEAKDSIGNISTVRKELVSNIRPVIEDVKTEYNSGHTESPDIVTVTIISNDNGAESYEYSINGTDYQESNVFEISKNGTYTVYIKDNYGNISDSQDITISNIKPFIINIKSEYNAADNIDTVTIQVSDNGCESFTYSVNEGEYQSSNEFVLSENGIYRFIVKDDLGNVSNWFSYEATTIRPVISDITQRVDTESGNAVIVVNTTQSGVYKYRMDNEIWQNANQFVVSKNGTHTFRVKDNYGNISEVYIEDVRCILPKLVSVTKTFDNNTYTFKITAEDNGGAPYVYFMYNESVSTQGIYNSFTVDKNGTYNFKAIDKYNNESNVISLTVSDIKPAVTSVTESDLITHVNLSVWVTDNGTGSYTYQMNDGPWQTSNIFSITKNGAYTIRVKDGDGNVSAEFIKEVVDIKPIITEIRENPPSSMTVPVATLIVKASRGNTPYYYSINGGEKQSLNKFKITENGVYSVVVYDSENMASEPMEFTVTNIDPDAARIETITLIVNDVSYDYYLKLEDVLDPQGNVKQINATMIAPSGITDSAYSYDGNDFTTDNTYVFKENGDHTIVIKDGEGHNVTANITIDNIFDEAELLRLIKESINAIGTVAYTEASKARIENARSAYNALPDTTKTKVDNYQKLLDAEAEYENLKAIAEKLAADTAEANKVEEKISAIGDVSLTDEVKARIDAARDAYNSLTDDQKSLVENYQYLVNAEEEYKSLKKATDDRAAADRVIELINNIGTVSYSDESKRKIDEAKNAYDALTKDQKALVTNYSDLTKAENKYKEYENAKAQSDLSAQSVKNVEDLISAIGTVTLSDDCKTKIDKARSAYDKLTGEEKNKVANYQTLKNAEETYRKLYEEKENEASSQITVTATTNNTTYAKPDGLKPQNSSGTTVSISSNSSFRDESESSDDKENSYQGKDASESSDTSPTINRITRRYIDTNKTALKIYVEADPTNPETPSLQYSLDNEHWQKDPSFTITKNGDYRVYVKDAYNNITVADVKVEDLPPEEVEQTDVDQAVEELSTDKSEIKWPYILIIALIAGGILLGIKAVSKD